MMRAPAGIATLGPISLNRLPSIRMIWFVSTRPASGSIRRPARIAVTAGATCAVAPDAANTQTRNAAAMRRMGSRLRRVRHFAAGLPRELLEPTHHVELRSNVVRRLRAGAVVLVVE